MKDAIILLGLLLGLATLVTVHIGIALRLFLRQRPRWRGLVALVVPPLAVIWGFKAGWKGLATIWLTAVAVYAVSLAAATVLG